MSESMSVDIPPHTIRQLPSERARGQPESVLYRMIQGL